jgi:hypothetical protein
MDFLSFLLVRSCRRHFRSFLDPDEDGKGVETTGRGSDIDTSGPETSTSEPADEGS